MQQSYERKVAKQSQLEENFLYDADFNNLAYSLGVDATGWSWSGKFGDLNNDGFLDLYVVNGMIAKEVFSHLPNFELVEKNQVFKGNAHSFESMQDWHLNATESGRGMSMADLDSDGDLDIIVNNLESPALIFENRVCGGNALEIDLKWDTANTKAVGATLTLETSSLTLTRTVSSISGYLSGDPSRIHFGIPEGEEIVSLSIFWPDGYVSVHKNLDLNTLVTIGRSAL